MRIHNTAEEGKETDQEGRKKKEYGEYRERSEVCICVVGVLLNYSLNGKACGTALYGKVSHRWV